MTRRGIAASFAGAVLIGGLAGCSHKVVFTNRSDETVTLRGTEPGPLFDMFQDHERTISLAPGESAELKVKRGAPIELEGRYALEIK